MRILKFVVSRQSIKPDPTCDFSDIVLGTEGYLEASFSFSKEWNGCGKIAVFTKLSKEYPVRLEGDTCIIPAEALTFRNFYVSVIGVRPGYRINTDKAEVLQHG